MQMKISPKKLSDALGIAVKWIPRRAVIQATEGFLLTFTNNKLEISAVDPSSGSITLFVKADSDIDNARLIIDAKKFLNIVSSMAKTGESIVIKLKKDKLLIECGGHKSTLVSIVDHGDFPMVDSGTDLSSSVDVSPLLFSESIPLVKGAADPDNPRTVLSGVHFNEGDVVSADGFRVIVKTGDVLFESPITIPAESCFKIASALSGIEEDVHVGTSQNGNKVFVSWDGGLISASVFSVNFPQYKSIIPNSCGASFSVKKIDMSVSIGITGQFASESENLVILSSGDGKLQVQSESGTGKHVSTVDMFDFNGDDFRVGVSYTYLMDAIQKMGSEVHFCTNGSSGIILVGEVGYYVHGIMPMHITESDDVHKE